MKQLSHPIPWRLIWCLPWLLLVIGCQPLLAALGEGPTPQPSATPTWPSLATATATIAPPTPVAPMPTDTTAPTVTPTPVVVTPLPTPLSTPTPGSGFYGDPALGFSFFYPSAWEATAGDEGLMVTSETPQVWVWSEPGLLEPGETVEEYLTQLYQEFNNIETVEFAADTTTTLRSGAKARVIEIAATEEFPQTRVTFVTRGRRVFAIFIFAGEKVFASYPHTLDAIAASMQVEEPRPYGIARHSALFIEGSQPTTLDPALANGSAGGIVGAIFSGLVMLDENLQVTPDLTEGWEVSAGGTVYTFHLRRNAYFHSGKPVTAHDVKFSWERAADPATKSDKVLTCLGDIVGVKAKFEGKAAEIAGVEVVDDYTLRVTIDAPKPYFLAKLTYTTSFIVDEENVRGQDWQHHPNGTGPFRLHTWQDDYLLILERNDNFYQPPAKLAHVVMTMYHDVSLWMYENNEIDRTVIGPSAVERATDPDDPVSSDLKIIPSLCTGRLILDVTMPPFDDPLVRRAFAYAVDRQKLVEVVLKGMAEPAQSILPPGMPGYNPKLDFPTFDPGRARQLLAQSTYGKAEALPKVVLTVGGLGSDLSSYESALLEMWRTHLGVEVTVEQLNPQTFLQDVHRYHGQITLLGWCADYPDPENFLDVLYHTAAQENIGHYSNPQVDKLLEQARAEPDIEARLALYHQIEQMIIADTPDILLDHDQEYLLLKPYLKDYPLSPIGLTLEWRKPYLDWPAD